MLDTTFNAQMVSGVLLSVLGAEELCQFCATAKTSEWTHADALLCAYRGATAIDSLDGVLTPYVQACSNSTGK